MKITPKALQPRADHFYIITPFFRCHGRLTFAYRLTPLFHDIDTLRTLTSYIPTTINTLCAKFLQSAYSPRQTPKPDKIDTISVNYCKAITKITKSSDSI